MATMNLRTKAKGSSALPSKKILNQRLPESLPDSSADLQHLDLFQKLTTCSDLDEQIAELRKAILSKSGAKDEEAIVSWYFRLPSNSSLKPAISATLNKLEDDSVFVAAFQTYLLQEIQTKQNLVQTIQRCFENCRPAHKAVKENLLKLYEVFTEDFEPDNALVRVLLSLETIGPSQNRSLLEKISAVIGTEKVLPDLRSNLCLLWLFEFRHQSGLEYFTEVCKLRSKSNQTIWLSMLFLQALKFLSGFKSQTDWSGLLWRLHLVNALVTLAKAEELFEAKEKEENLAIEGLVDELVIVADS